MKLRNKISAVMAAGVIAMSMAAPTFALEHKEVYAYKNAATGEKFKSNIPLLGISPDKVTNECFSGGVDLKGNLLKNVYTKKVYVLGIPSEVMSITGENGDETNMSNSGIYKVFSFKSGLNPKYSSNLNTDFYTIDAHIKAAGAFNKTKTIDLAIQ